MDATIFFFSEGEWKQNGLFFFTVFWRKIPSASSSNRWYNLDPKFCNQLTLTPGAKHTSKESMGVWCVGLFACARKQGYSCCNPLCLSHVDAWPVCSSDFKLPHLQAKNFAAYLSNRLLFYNVILQLVLLYLWMEDRAEGL